MELISNATKIKGVNILKSSKFKDERGSFIRAYDFKFLSNNNCNFRISDINISETKKKGTLRGLHLQKPPFEEIKLIRCIKGKIFDVAVDLRKNSDTYLQYTSLVLEEGDCKALIIPKGCAHGFQTLTDNCTLLYIHSACYSKESEDGVNYLDSSINIKWPEKITFISEKDKSLRFLDKKI